MTKINIEAVRKDSQNRIQLLKDECGQTYTRSEILEKLKNGTDVFAKDQFSHSTPVRIYGEFWIRTIRDDDCDNLDNLPTF